MFFIRFKTYFLAFTNVCSWFNFFPLGIALSSELSKIYSIYAVCIQSGLSIHSVHTYILKTCLDLVCICTRLFERCMVLKISLINVQMDNTDSVSPRFLREFNLCPKDI